MVSDTVTWNFNSFPDSHEDDLIVEIFESNGKEFGRALVPLAKATEVSVSHFTYVPFSFVSTFQMFLMKNAYRLIHFPGSLYFVSRDINLWEKSRSILTIQQVLMIIAN